MRDREDYFKEYVEALYKREKEEKRKEKEKVLLQIPIHWFDSYIV